jgi:Domain of unknown function (DUF4326)
MSEKPIRIQRKRTKGWKMPKNTVDCTRPGPWGNPYATSKNGMSKDNDYWQHYAVLIDGDMPLSDDDSGEEAAAWRKWVLEHIHELRGKNLACWCPKPPPYGRDKCHAATLLELANQEETSKDTHRNGESYV